MQRTEKQVVEADLRSLRFGTRMARCPPLDIFAHWLLNTTAFTVLMVFVIVINSILIAVDMEHDNSSNETEGKIMEGLDFFFLMLYVIEIALKWIDDFRGFWKEGWNIFDFFITAIVSKLTIQVIEHFLSNSLLIKSYCKLSHWWLPSLTSFLVKKHSKIMRKTLKDCFWS